jgi:flagellar hook-basal body complex protein FliE
MTGPSGVFLRDAMTLKLTPPVGEAPEALKEGEGFKSEVVKCLNEVNQNQLVAQDESLKLARGESRNVHEALISMEKAQMSLNFTLQVRNKVIESYQEIMRMQV